jgi:hypothetical protein
MGGGLGHLTRLRAARFTLDLLGPTTIISAQPSASDPRLTGGATVLAPPPALNGQRAAFGRWLLAAIQACRPRLVLLDAFPLGVLGEWGDPALAQDVFDLCRAVPVVHLARRLRFDVYARRAGLCDSTTTHALSLSTSFVLEPLEDAHQAFLSRHSQQVRSLVLQDPPTTAPAPPVPRPQPGTPWWLVVHSGPQAEVLQLVGCARARAAASPQAGGPRPQIDVIANDESVPGAHDIYPAAPLFVDAAAVFTGAGFNAIRQGTPPGVVHHVLPFARALDDQRWRAGYTATQRAPGSLVIEETA